MNSFRRDRVCISKRDYCFFVKVAYINSAQESKMLTSNVNLSRDKEVNSTAYLLVVNLNGSKSFRNVSDRIRTNEICFTVGINISFIDIDLNYIDVKEMLLEYKCFLY